LEDLAESTCGKRETNDENTLVLLRDERKLGIWLREDLFSQHIGKTREENTLVLVSFPYSHVINNAENQIK